MPLSDLPRIQQGASQAEINDYLIMLGRRLNDFLNHLDTLNVDELDAGVVNTGVLNAALVTIKAVLTGATITLDSYGITVNNGTKNTFRVDVNGNVTAEDGTITGGTVRTAIPGNKRIELTGGLFAGYYSDDQLHGLVFNPAAPSNFFDMFIYHDGTQMLEFYDEGTSIKVRPGSGASFWTLGKSTGITYIDGQMVFNSTASLDLGPNTATGRVQYANQADSALSASSASSVDWSNVTNHPDPTTLPLQDGTAAIGSSDKYAYSDHRHPTDSSRAAVNSPAFTGSPTAPTPSTSDNSTAIATTAYVQNQGFASKTLPNWTAPTFQNSWVDFGGGSVCPAGYYKDDMSVVRLRGFVSSGTVGLTIFNLPVGYRPLHDCNIPVVSNDTFGKLVVKTTGNVVLSIGSNAYVDLSSVSFRAEQ